jgi:starvation-inducible outer membrane lipoprotein
MREGAGRNRSIFPTALLFVLVLSGCATIPKEALQLSPESLKLRQLQTRRYDTDEKTLLTSSALLLQDLGFNIQESSTELGVITCSKDREAISTSQIIGAIALAVLTGVVAPVDKAQLIRASVVTHPVRIDLADKSKNQTAVRVTFQRIVINTQNQISRQECIVEEQIYQEFFDKLSKSLFLEAHDI